MKVKKTLSVFLTLILFVFLFGCDGKTTIIDKGKEKAVPVYQGMQVSGVLEKQTAYKTPLFFSSENDDDQGEDDDEINQEDPFNNFDGETIESEINSSLDVVTSDEVEYYTSKNKDFYITVKLLNPDNFVILSFTLNGVFYQNYQFQDGSDSENLILKANSGDVSGIKDYTIDAIKYIDGTEIKDAIFAGDRTVKVGVTYEDFPYARVTDLNVDTTSVSFNAEVADPANLIELYESPLKAYLYDGENIIKEQDLIVGNNEVSFDKLRQDTLYQYAIVTSYDALDGNGSQLVILDKHAFYTNKMLYLSINEEAQDSVSFNLTIDDSKEVGSLTSIELYKGSELVESLTDLTLREFTELLSNNLYEIKVVYTYDLNDEVGAQEVTTRHEVTTKAKATPTLEIVDVLETQTSISFNLTIVDADSVGAVTSIKLYKGTEEVQSLTDLTLREFTGLLSNNLYEIKVVYTYDLNDGVGEQEVTARHEVTTKAKATPTLEIVDVLETQTSIGFNLTIIDTDSVGALTSVELYKGSELVESLIDLTLREFTGLLSNNIYEIKVVYTCNLNDGVGAQEVISKHQVTTKAKATPTLEIVDVLETQTSLGFDLSIVDADSVGAVTKIELYKGSELVESLTDLTLREFTGLLSNNLYEIKVVYTYDLNDGVGAQEATSKYQITTKAKATPTLEIVDVLETQDTIGFNLTIIDTDSVGALTSVELYKGSELVESLIDVTLREFSGLLSNNLYEIKVVYTCNLNDGVGAQEVISKHQVTTKAKATPTLEIVDVLETQDTIGFNLTIVDVDTAGSITSIELYKGSELVESLIDVTLREFTGLLSNNIYEIKVVYTYNLNDGVGAQEIVVVKESVTLAVPIEMTGINILNTSYPKVGEEVHIRVSYNNPSSLSIKAFYVNDQKVDVLTSNTATSAIIKFIPEFDGGMYDVYITAIDYQSHNHIKHQAISSTYTDDILILGDLGILSIEEPNGLDYLIKGQMNYLVINLDNPTGYDIGEVVVQIEHEEHKYDSSRIQKVDNNTIKIIYDIESYYWNHFINFKIVSITYGTEGIEYSTKTISNVSKTFYCVKSSIVRSVSTIEELQNMESEYIYQLKNDIDAINYNWTPYDFTGILYGNGFEVRNLAIAIENESEDEQKIGLFKTFNGMIDGLGLVDAYISVKTKGDVCVGGFAGSIGIIKNSYVSGTTITVATNSGAYVGGLVGYSSITNSHVSGTTIIVNANSSASVGGLVGRGISNDSYVSETTITVTTNSYAYVGGLVGYNPSSNSITNSYVSGTIITVETTGSTSSSVYVGGLMGASGDSNSSYVINTKITVTTNSSARVGGLVGETYNPINNSYVSGISITVTTTLSARVGGLVGYNFNSINDTYVSGTTIIVNATSYAHVGGIVGQSHDFVSNSHISNDVVLMLNGVNQEISFTIRTNRLDEKRFYVDDLGWSEEVWNFDLLDYQNNQFPTLRK